MPLAIQPATSKDGTVSFDNITNTPVYISAAYDPSGQWDAHSSPPDGTSLGMYSDGSGQPKAVELKPGKTTKVDLAFDDRMKMNGGKPAPAQ